MADEPLHHDHAALVLLDSSTVESRQVELIEAAATRGVQGLRLEGCSLDVDVPIPLIYEVEANAWFAVDGATADAAGWLGIDLWGEAYGRRYGVRLRGRVGEEYLLLLDVPTEDSDATRERFAAGWPRFCALLGRELAARTILELLAFGLPEPLRDEWEARALSAL
jgi:hypothetical protein